MGQDNVAENTTAEKLVEGPWDRLDHCEAKLGFIEAACVWIGINNSYDADDLNGLSYIIRDIRAEMSGIANEFRKREP